jgi:murein hydrolase activator
MPAMEKTSRLQPVGWLLVILLIAAHANAVETDAELEATREAVRALEREQNQRLREIERLEERVMEVARRNLQLRRELRELDEEVAARDLEVASLLKEVERLDAELEAARRQASLLLRSQWLRERHPGWARGDDAGVRHLREFDSRVQAGRERMLARIAAQVAALAEARDRLAESRATLAARQAEVRRLLRDIERQEEEQSALLARVQQQVESDALELERLESNARTLERELRRMEELKRAALAAPAPRETDGGTPPFTPRPGSPFASVEGQLQRPVDGDFLYRYGNPRGNGLHGQWRGEVFAAGEDSAVRAVHHGDTVYADWMRGYGFLVILDHGDGYLTLYGNNRELLTHPGQQVAGGDIIARAGATSPVIAPGLYFELRHRGETLNPAAWWHSK